jgi:hypothetical protein
MLRQSPENSMTAHRPKIACVLALALLLCAPPAAAAELACEGVFSPDSSEARFIEHFGRENVDTGEVPGPEGTTMIATTVYPGDPEREFQAVWWNEETLADLSFVTVPAGDTAPGGVRLGMSVEEVEALNGEPFTLLGFYWDYGGSAGFQSGRLAALPGGCHLSLTFEPTATSPTGTESSAIVGDVEVSSSLPELREVAPKLIELSFGYPHPDFR